jgi:imidazolonepropionase-like amidohydrolase
VPRPVTGREAAEAGQRSLEHLTGIPSPGDTAFAATVATIRRTGSSVDPTLSVFWMLAHLTDPVITSESRIATASASLKAFWETQKVGWSTPPVAEEMRTFYQQNLATVRALHRAGVPLLTGTDLGFSYLLPGISVHEELEHLVEAGLTPLAALRAATINPARYFHRDYELGSIAVGKLADLVLLDANPLVSIGNTRRIRAVVANGRVFDRTELDRLLSGAGR